MLVNTITLTTPTLDPIGLCFHPLAALANHSCAPTASITFSGRTLHLRSLAPLDRATEITIPYIDTTYPTRVRQEELRSRWFFACTCAVCALAPAAPTDVYICTSCGTPTVPDRAPYVCTVCASAQRAPLPGACTDLHALHASGQFPLRRQPLPAAHLAALQTLLAAGDFAGALKHQLLLHTRVNPVLYGQPHHPVRVAGGFVLAALLMEVMRAPGNELASVGVDWAKAVWAVLAEVEAGVNGSHGNESPFAKAVRAKQKEVSEELVKAGVTWAKNGRVEGLQDELAKVAKVVDGLVADLKT